MEKTNKRFSIKDYLKKNRDALNTRTAKVGGYSVLMSVIALLILIALNVFAEALPSNLTQYDISSAQLYSLTSSTKVVVQNLEKEVKIYWIVQSGEEDTVIERLLGVYDALSDNLEIIKKNPDVYPTFAKQYTEDTVYNNSLIVECGDKSRYISYYDIYEYDTTDYYTTGSATQYFDGEGEITTAIDYVISDDLPQIYLLTGHGEAELSETIATSIERANMETSEFSLLNVDEVPKDADCVIINSPTSDLSKEEAKMLSEYVANGGHLLVFAGLKEEGSLENLQTVLENYGVTTNEGIVLEGNREYYAFQAPYICLPEIESSEITDALLEGTNYVIVSIAQGMTVSSSNNGATVTSLLSTSDAAFSKLEGYALTSYEQTEEDIAGPFSLAVSVEDGKGKMVWVSSDYVIDDMYISYSSGANTDFVMNSLSWMIGESETIAIRSKSLDYTYLTISDSQASTIKICLIGIIPLAYLLYGIDEVIRRRKKA